MGPVLRPRPALARALRRAADRIEPRRSNFYEASISRDGSAGVPVWTMRAGDVVRGITYDHGAGYVKLSFVADASHAA